MRARRGRGRGGRTRDRSHRRGVAGSGHGGHPRPRDREAHGERAGFGRQTVDRESGVDRSLRRRWTEIHGEAEREGPPELLDLVGSRGRLRHVGLRVLDGRLRPDGLRLGGLRLGGPRCFCAFRLLHRRVLDPRPAFLLRLHHRGFPHRLRLLEPVAESAVPLRSGSGLGRRSGGLRVEQSGGGSDHGGGDPGNAGVRMRAGSGWRRPGRRLRRAGRCPRSAAAPTAWRPRRPRRAT